MKHLLILVAFVLLAGFIAGCCDGGQWKCDGNFLQWCDAGEWKDFLNCEKACDKDKGVCVTYEDNKDAGCTCE